MPKLFTILVFLGLSACQSADQNDEVEGRTMGTSYSIKAQTIKIDQHQIDQRLKQINQIFSSWDQNSELSALNRQPVGGVADISTDMSFVLSEAVSLHGQTSGFFNPGMGQLIDVWGFGVADVKHKPSRSEIAKALNNSLIEQLKLSKLKLEKSADIQLNLSAIAKGYAVDEIAKILNNQQGERFMVEIGGEIKVKGSWSIGIEAPVGQPAIAINLVDESIATSGNYRQYFVWQGRRYAHILDPHTGLPVDSDLFSASVIHKSNMLADAYATAMMAMGSVKAAKMARQLKLKTVLILNKCGDPCLSQNIIKIGL
ncbi:FAD:protein FMN transferase [Candidatus Thioglobus sp.]|jgi:thiamine biosynthesis lipoprotein|uniref:FAD:protein FMN transferase n=1 Tax=Candidatus Thioglobus sp. TaxID=2026721 RepID=UPI001DD9639B|nr:FAD:protein FMN transferase [Candidatus Thioglobus sp.]MBT3277427.1 FAD:protein FMN transferase [Candidatus Thioglobus sp.]MBT3446655.1 FAD:protein FMN transferase [Candidatus Thioglobus sp.]MBT4001109.1 FAD:protein FMN transferase [Candidatus Thioglobus sp.]MBT4182254.1 FAD:protein FMN transferase [Candidatus Thioglobus sp.]MBT4747271.1 FAD:protein FMN transferase [Candidatus Thioglobus sp.]